MGKVNDPKKVIGLHVKDFIVGEERYPLARRHAILVGILLGTAGGQQRVALGLRQPAATRFQRAGLGPCTPDSWPVAGRPLPCNAES